MTREEAIYRLKNTAWLGSNEDRETTEEAVNMAISALSAEPQNCWNCKHYEPKHDVCHAPELVKQVTSKLKKPCDSLLTDDKDDSKEHKSKLDGDLISRADAIEAVRLETAMRGLLGRGDILDILFALPSAEAVQGWIPCSERLPKINQRVLLATNEGRVFVGYKEKPDLVWRVTDADGREHWVYDPEHYTDDIDILLKEDDCSFSEDNQYSDGFLSVTSINYDDRFEGVTAWMPLPSPYKGGDTE
jgi:hypothetical protein